VAQRRSPALVFGAVHQDQITGENRREHGSLSFSDTKKDGAREATEVRPKKGPPRFRLILNGEGLTGSNGAPEQRYLDERRVAEVSGRGRGRQVEKVVEGKTKDLSEALSIAPVKTNLPGKETTYSGLGTMQPGSESGLGHALGGKAKKALLEVGEFHGKSVCQSGINSKGILARKE